MPDTEWRNFDNWDYEDWTDIEKKPLESILELIAGACDERQAMVEQSHESGFDADNKWPIREVGLYTDAQNGLSDTNRERIEKAIWPRPVLKTTDINQSGGSVTAGDIPGAKMQLEDVLQEVFGYASGVPLSTTQELQRMSVLKQWFEVLDYPEFYEQKLIEDGAGGSETPWCTDIETQYINVETEYIYNDPDDLFLSAECIVTEPRSSSAPNDVYVANDLNESSPFSTPTEVRDYTIDKYDEAVTDDNWYTAEDDAETFLIQSYIRFQLINNEDNPLPEKIVKVWIRNSRIRFKVPDIFRATMPDKFTATVKFYGFYADPNQTDFSFDDLGTGETEDEVLFLTLTADGSDYYYLEVANPDFTSPTVPTFPTSGGEINGYGMRRILLASAQNGNLNAIRNAVIIAPNREDEFLYYTPP